MMEIFSNRVASCLNCSLLVGTAVLFGYTVLLLVVLSYRLLDRWELCAGAAAADKGGLAWRCVTSLFCLYSTVEPHCITPANKFDRCLSDATILPRPAIG